MFIALMMYKIASNPSFFPLPDSTIRNIIREFLETELKQKIHLLIFKTKHRKIYQDFIVSGMHEIPGDL